MNNAALIADREVLVSPPTSSGGKAWQLARLRRYGLPVPDFLVIPAAWSTLRGGDFPPALGEALHAALAARGWLETPLAVRSSAVDEDGAGASFAGIYRSCLNVRGPAALAAAVAEVWASLDTGAAVAYRQALGRNARPAMAVIVMPLLAARASGVAFTCDPRSGREDRLIAHAVRGLGETLVGGETGGEEYEFAEDAADTWRLHAFRAGAQTAQSVPAPAGGTQRLPLPPEKPAQGILDRERAEELAALLRDAALAFDYVAPFLDIEWVWDGAAFWLTQARPVTRRPQRTYEALQGKAAVWTRGNTCEVMPEPLQPMDWNFSRRAVNDLLTQGWRLAHYPLQPGVQRAALFHGRLYLEAGILQWESWDAIGLAPDSFNALMGGHQPAIAVARPTPGERLRRLGRIARYALAAPAVRRRGEAAIARMRRLSREALHAPLPADPDGLHDLLFRLARPAREEVDLFFLQGSGGGSLALLSETLEKSFPGEGQALGAALLAGGEESVTARQGYALLALARQAAACAGEPLDDPGFAAAFAAFLDEYGHRGHYETYLRSPRWRDVPEQLLSQLPALATVDETALRRRQSEAAEAAWQRIRKTLPLWKRSFLRGLSEAARRECNQREAARSALIALLEACRRVWLAIGGQLSASGLLANREEIFWLFPGEVERAIAGRLPAAGLRARIDERAERFRRWQAEDAPEYLSLAASGGAPVDGARPPAAVAGRDTWRGVPTGTGVGRGRVRVLRHPDQGMELLPGEVLLAPSTDPGWTPLFLKAAGLVVETGGYLSHGAIVARELALPAVVNLPGILGQLRDGDEVEVDGRSGTVRRL